MLAIGLISILLAGAPAQTAKCVVSSPAGAVAKYKNWYIASTAVAFAGKVWTKYGLPRVLMPAEVEQIGLYKGAAVYKERGVADYDVIYVLADLEDCSFQPYGVKS